MLSNEGLGVNGDQEKFPRNSSKDSEHQDDLYNWMAKQQEYTNSHSLQHPNNKPSVTFNQVGKYYIWASESLEFINFLYQTNVS